MPAAKTSHRLTEMTFDEVSYVDKGAGEGVRVLLYKRDGEAAPDGAADLEALAQAVEKVGRKVSGANLSRLRDIVAPLVDFIEEHDDTSHNASQEGDTTMSKQDTVEKTEVEELLKAASPELVELFKGMNDRLTSAESRAQMAEDIAKAERDSRETAEFVSKAEGLSHIPGVVPAEFGPVLRRIAKGAEEADYAALEKVLTGAEAAFASSNTIYATAGLDSTSGAVAKASSRDPMAGINTAARELITKGEARDLPSAIRKVQETRKDLVEEYRQAAGI